MPLLFQQALEPNVHEHYVDLHLRTYRLFVLQPELYSRPLLSSQRTKPMQLCFRTRICRDKDAQLVGELLLGKIPRLSFASEVQKGSHGES